MTNSEHFSQSSKKRKRKESGDGSHDYPDVALDQLQMNTLRRYKRHFKLQTRQGLSKSQLVEVVTRHFRSIPINQTEAVAYFIYMVKMDKNRVDHSVTHNRSDDERKEAKSDK